VSLQGCGRFDAGATAFRMLIAVFFADSAVVVAGAFDDASADAEAIGGLLNEDRRQPAFHNHLPSGF